MAKAIKFPLEMDGEQVRDIDSLKEHFDIEKVVEYFLSGKLLTWLEARYYDDEADAVAQFSSDDPDVAGKLCDIFGIEHEEEPAVDVEAIAERNARIARLKEYTDDEEIIRNVDSVAFDQEELADLYDRDVERIYLCEGKFSIPKSKSNLEYILVGNATASGLQSSGKEEHKTQREEYEEYSLAREGVMKQEWKMAKKRSVGITCSAKELQTLDLFDDIRCCEEKIYQKKTIHFPYVVDCDGDLLFENCILHCGENDDGFIRLNSGSLILRNCKIIGHKRGQTSMIQALYAKEGHTSIRIESCEFANAGEFLSSSVDVDVVNCKINDARASLFCGVDDQKVRFKDCEFSFLKKKRNDYIYDYACMIGGEFASFDHCLFRGRQDLSGISAFPEHVSEDMLDELDAVMWKARDYEQETLSIDFLNIQKCEMNDCLVSGMYFDGSQMTIRDSCFDNCSVGVGEGEILNCTFNTSVLGIGDCDCVMISDSQFYRCVIAAERDESCEYINCKFADQAPFEYSYNDEY